MLNKKAFEYGMLPIQSYEVEGEIYLRYIAILIGYIVFRVRL